MEKITKKTNYEKLWGPASFECGLDFFKQSHSVDYNVNKNKFDLNDVTSISIDELINQERLNCKKMNFLQRVLLFFGFSRSE